MGFLLAVHVGNVKPGMYVHVISSRVAITPILSNSSAKTVVKSNWKSSFLVLINMYSQQLCNHVIIHIASEEQKEMRDL